jgi:hypothetical protein
MTKVEAKLIAGFDAAREYSDSPNVHEIVREAMADIKWSWSSYSRYSHVLFTMLGTVFEAPNSIQRDRGEDYEWFRVVLQKVGK